MNTRRSLGTVAVLVAFWSTSAQAQLGDPRDGATRAGTARSSGTVTVTSSPAGAIVTLEGQGIRLVGRTPWTISRGLEGIFVLRSHLDAYESSETIVYLNPASDETVHMDLAKKTATKAGMRSLFVPGWGQHYSDRGAAGAGYFGSAIAASVYLGIQAIRYEDRIDDLDAAHRAYAESSVQSEREQLWTEVERRRERADDVADQRRLAFVILGAVWGVNLLDSLLFFPDAGSSVVTSSSTDTGLYVVPGSDGMTLGLRVGF